MSRWFVGLLLALLLPSYAAAALGQAIAAPAQQAAATEVCAAPQGNPAPCPADDLFDELPGTAAHDAASDLPELFARLPDHCAHGRRSDTPPLASRTQAPTPFLEGLMRPPCAA